MLTVERSYRVQQIERIASLRDKQQYKPIGLVLQCSWCKRVKVSPSRWEYVHIDYGQDVSGCVCPSCSEKTKKEGEK
jgi:hypothetical protein